MNKSVNTYSNGVSLIDLMQPIDGYKHFISSWFFRIKDKVILVDTGPVSSLSHLFAFFFDNLVEKIDYLLLTHIHIDHAGGAGELVKNFPVDHVICHSRAIPHLINPEKLWTGSLKVLGETAKTFGPVKPISQKLLSFHENVSIAGEEIKIIETPGHAAHHLSYLHQGNLFCGEALGVNVESENGPYIRLATPPVFKYPIFRNSILKLKKEDVQWVCFGHHGIRGDHQRICREALDQLDLWLELIKPYAQKDSEIDYDAILETLLQKDQTLHRFNQLLPTDKRREIYYTKNSIKGIWEYIKKEKI